MKIENWKDEKVNEGHTSTDNNTKWISKYKLKLVRQNNERKNKFIKCIWFNMMIDSIEPCFIDESNMTQFLTMN